MKQQSDLAPLVCECGSDEVCIAYSTPVFVVVKSNMLQKVVAQDEESRFGGVVRCLDCDRFWILDSEPEVGIMPR